MGNDAGVGASELAEHASSRSNGSRGSAAPWLATAAVAVVLILVLTPFTSASSNGTGGTVKAPYAGLLDVSSSTGTNGCGHGTIVKSPVFNLTTGIGHGAINASTPNCAPSVNGNVGDASATMGLATTNFTTTTGAHKIGAKWSLHWSWSEKIVAPSGAGTTEAIVQVTAGIGIQDMTNFSSVQKLTFHQHVAFGNTSFGGGGNVTVSVTQNVTLVAGHWYYIFAVVNAFAYTTVQSSPGATSYAKVDFSTGTNHATLLSYSFT